MFLKVAMITRPKDEAQSDEWLLLAEGEMGVDRKWGEKRQSRAILNSRDFYLKTELWVLNPQPVT